MYDKDKKDLIKNWVFVILAAVLGFLVNLASSAAYDLYTEGHEQSKVAILIFSVVLSIFVGGFLNYFFNNIEVLKDEKIGLLKMIWMYIKYLFTNK